MARLILIFEWKYDYLFIIDIFIIYIFKQTVY